MPTNGRPMSGGAGELLRARVHLVGSRPEIWRLFEVDSSLCLDEFHQVLQIVMGWEDSHLHSFTDRSPNTRGRAGSPARSWAPVYVRAEDEEDWYLPEETVQLGEVLGEGSSPLFYEYDFSDGWIHRIDWIETVGKAAGDPRARIIRGERRCPLEDCGGIGGYEDLLAVLGDPDAEDHEELREWAQSTAQRAGEDGFDPEGFDPERANRNLGQLFESEDS